MNAHLTDASGGEERIDANHSHPPTVQSLMSPVCSALWPPQDTPAAQQEPPNRLRRSPRPVQTDCEPQFTRKSISRPHRNMFSMFFSMQSNSQHLPGCRLKSTPKPGGTFKTFGGLIEGRNVELIPGQRIVQAWRPASWDPGPLLHRPLRTEAQWLSNPAHPRPHRLP